MRNELEIFKNEEFGEVRTVEINGEPYFVAVDIAKALGYKNTNDAIIRHCRWVVKHDIPHPQSRNKTSEVNVIPEGDLYRLITGSDLPSAKEFESWVYDEVLPQLRQTGTYSTNTTCQYPIPASSIESATNAGRLLERLMRLQGASPFEIAMVVKSIYQQAGIEILDCFIKIPAYEQLSFNEIITR